MPKYAANTNFDDYAPVADRIELFYKDWPSGRITTKLVSSDQRQMIVKAFVYRDATEARAASTGYAAEREGDGEINMVACLENTETSAIGRALANLGYTASRKRPSREEMLKASRARQAISPRPIKAVAERAPDQSPKRVSNPLIIQDFLDVITRAEQHGLGAARARVLRECVGSYRPVEPHRLIRIEARVRYWLRRRKAV